MGLIKDAIEFFRPNPLDSMLERMQKKEQQSILLIWNRGLGDIPLGLYAMVERIRAYLPDAEITFLTRHDLKDGFKLLEDVEVIVGHDFKRGQPFDIEKALGIHGMSREDFDLVIENPDPTRWVKWQLGHLVPKLKWDSSWDSLSDGFGFEEGKKYIGIHVDTETGQHYGYEKNWPFKYWYEFIKRAIEEKGCNVVLFGFAPEPEFDLKSVIDLRGKTQLLSLLSIVKNKLDYLVVPDSGLLSLTYYVDAAFPLKMVSLWSDPRQGVLKQNVDSPNPDLLHIPLIGQDESVANISVEHVMQSLFS